MSCLIFLCTCFCRLQHQLIANYHHGDSNLLTVYYHLYWNVKTLKDADLMQTFIIPQFAKLGRMDQNKFMHQMCERWPELRKQQPLVNALKNLAFVPVSRATGAANNEASQAGVAKLYSFALY